MEMSPDAWVVKNVRIKTVIKDVVILMDLINKIVLQCKIDIAKFVYAIGLAI